MKRFRWPILFLVVVAVVGGWLAADHALYRRADPAGRFSTLAGFLAVNPSADQFALTDVNGSQHVLAYGPYGRTLPSGPAAYVFGPGGALVDWSLDIGDHPAFDQKWNAQRAPSTRGVSRSQVTALAATRPGG
ncbi:MAG TPA: hypothetical protein VF796_02745 [Humisphaera sp.]